MTRAEQADALRADGAADGGYRLRVRVPMRWGDMDAYGHINNVQIVRMLEEARIAAFGPPGGTGASGIDPEVPLFSDVPHGTLALVVEHRVRYVKPLDYRNVPAEVDVWVSGLKAAALTLDYIIHDPVDGHECVRATTALAFVDEASGRLLRLTPEQRERLSPFVGKGLFER
ncbi:thioesterase family protein [Sinomonas sp. JGH33]|uniref:Thioesterase family protein n=1 Tax=Sinomonas terricola TaxID=3110330 RepID=A0ABU5T347_9MICC|nr:thioesterase family protein [Sinomonas sp. JGH33]MEA5454089.1 thioesterase family protein [Sinomonas sp. JGH33]